MKKNKVVLPLIIILLLCFLPCSIYGTYHQIMDKKEKGNPNHLHKLDNKLYYYNANDKLIGIYECQNDDCDTAKTTVGQTTVNVYQGNNFDTQIFASEYIFIQDGEQVILYNLKIGRNILTLKSIKNYGVNFDNQTIIIQNEDRLYGLLNMEDMAVVVPAEYEEMDITDTFDGTNLIADKIAVKDNSGYYIISDTGEKLSEAKNYPIYDYDSEYIYHQDNDEKYYIYQYDGTRVLGSVEIIKYGKLNGYNIILNNNGRVTIYDESFETIEEYGEFGQVLDFKIEDELIQIYNGPTLIDSFDTTDKE